MKPQQKYQKQGKNIISKPGNSGQMSSRVQVTTEQKRSKASNKTKRGRPGAKVGDEEMEG